MRLWGDRNYNLEKLTPLCHIAKYFHFNNSLFTHYKNLIKNLRTNSICEYLNMENILEGTIYLAFYYIGSGRL